jgi:hypothetical protein
VFLLKFNFGNKLIVKSLIELFVIPELQKDGQPILGYP